MRIAVTERPASSLQEPLWLVPGHGRAQDGDNRNPWLAPRNATAVMLIMRIHDRPRLQPMLNRSGHRRYVREELLVCREYYLY
ncbi:MAG: hypothetical protein ACTSU0_07615, partial [Alphaproteobacteria bacterium]